MRVVLFCGGFGRRIRGRTENTPKPLITIGGQPILLHIMKYYAHFGHKDFVLCLGYKADSIKDYFLKTFEATESTLTGSFNQNGGKHFSESYDDWRVTFVDTGLDTIIGQRLRAVEPFIEDDEPFLVNYSDGVTDFHLPNLLSYFHENRPTGAFLSVRPRSNSFHEVRSDSEGRVENIQPIHLSDIWMNGGFFVFNREIFDYIGKDEELVDEPFTRLIAEKKLRTLRYDGFWAAMDTFKEREILEDMASDGHGPWEVWKGPKPVTNVRLLNRRQKDVRARRPSSGSSRSKTS